MFDNPESSGPLMGWYEPPTANSYEPPSMNSFEQQLEAHISLHQPVAVSR
ncbi:hypothetical protein sscle_06g055040 [Sclerotinia sclerotiorum 1980 UF-70]|uniref:Uncharacterized protein n=1 Tax=Sclerotinia sclerotiorum (strain ATCC 18683 / 1980 / Ss-1) TaxID=665079 RepID=A0A1D9Q710_SCLS1|nr:hypothetical protein sscle_06g055040 [Sclerotinia sclerotiorum 1980 UF-70]